MYYRILATLALSFIVYVGQSQESYHRLYETSLNDQMGMNDTLFYHMSSTTTSGDVYAMGTKRVGESPMGIEDLTVIFTKHNNKGNIDWSRELDLGQDTIALLGFGSFEFNGAQDSILFTMAVEINGERSELFGRLDALGTELDLRTVGGLIYSTTNEFPKVASFINNSDLLVTTGQQPIISRIGKGDDLIWSRAYDFTNDNGESLLHTITDIQMTQDSTIILTGIPDGVDDDFVIIELDSNGVQLWAESYLLSVNNLGSMRTNGVEPLDDGTFAVAGSYFSDSPFTSNGFIAIVDTLGSILMAKTISPIENSSRVSNLLKADDGTLWLSGVYNDDSSRYFTANMSLDGTINWTTIYPGEEAGFGPFTSSLINVQATGGATLVGHGYIGDLPVLQVMKHNLDGTTPCSDTTSIFIQELGMVDDTLTSSVVNGGIFFDSLAFELTNFNGFNPPVLSILSEMQFCPNELIDTFLVANVSGVDKENISYEWSTGEFTDTIAVMAEGEYSVTVTISEDVCYMMCDTIEITRLTVPQIAITQDNSRFCEEKIIVLTGNYTAGAEGETYLWNTMDSTLSIEVTEAGVYSVTVTDNCNEMASDDVDVSLPVFDPSVFFGANTTDFCITGSAVVTAAYTGGGNQPEFIWSDGQTGNPIIVTIPGSYAVSVTDECGNMANFTEDIIFPEIATQAEITFTPNCNEENPAASTVIFEGTGNGEIEIAVYQVDNDGNQILITESNPTNQLQLLNYIVFAFDICGNTLDSLAINTTAVCGGILRYPIAFFPGGTDDESRTFGPIPSDTMNVDRITDVEFKVFNRWGETVYESNAILEPWDGTHKGEPAPSEVYIWYNSYIIDGQQMLDKGDVTLLR